MTATPSTPKHFYDLFSDQADDPTQTTQFFQDIPTDQRHQFVSYRDQEGRTPLYIAAQRGHQQIVEMLLAAGVDMKAAANDGATPIFIAAQERHHRVVEMLVAAGADMNAATGATPICFASGNGPNPSSCGNITCSWC